MGERNTLSHSNVEHTHTDTLLLQLQPWLALARKREYYGLNEVKIMFVSTYIHIQVIKIIEHILW